MWNPNTQTYLTDEIERKLIQHAIEEQNRLRPVRALKNLFLRMSRKV